MTGPRGFKQRLAVVSRLRDEADYDRALTEVEGLLETWPGNAHLHVVRAKLIQLQDDPKYDLADAKRTLLQAAELDRRSPAAAIELGYFLDNVEDDPQAAARVFAEGVAAARSLLIDGLIGQAKAYQQLDRREDFRRCLLEAIALTQSDAGAKRGKADDRGSDVIIQSPAGHVYAVQLKGRYTAQIQDLLSELAADGPG